MGLTHLKVWTQTHPCANSDTPEQDFSRRRDELHICPQRIHLMQILLLIDSYDFVMVNVTFRGQSEDRCTLLNCT